MTWRDLLAPQKETIILPWVGGQRIYGSGRRWKIVGRLPEEYGWCSFSIDGGRSATYEGPAEEPFGWEEEGVQGKREIGYLVGNRLIPDSCSIFPDLDLFLQQTSFVHMVDRGLDRFSRVLVVKYEQQFYLYVRPEFPLGPESEVLEAFLNRGESVVGIKGVTPALDLAFRFETWLREQQEERRRQIAQRIREEEERQERERRHQELMKSVGSSVGRRRLARIDFHAAVEATLKVSGATLLDVRDTYRPNEAIIRFRHERQQFECIVEKATMHVLNAGICLNGNDGLFTLESLPSVISQAIRERRLHITRRANDDEPWDDEEDGEDW